VKGTLLFGVPQSLNRLMNMNGMERVWHGSHRKAVGRNWSMYSALILLVLMSWVVLAYPH
jgi:hypothetical protein